MNETSAPHTTPRPLHTVVLRLLLASAVFWIPLVIFLVLANGVRGNRPLYGDIGILRAIHHVASPLLDKVAVFLTMLGSAPVVAVGVVVAAAVLYMIHKRRSAVFLLFTIGGTAVINLLLKALFHRTRPDLWPRIVTETDYSFPSGHAMITSALAFAVIFLCWRTRYRWYAVGFGSVYFVAVSLSRLYLDVHYPSDILAGWIVSLLWVLVVRYVFERYRSRPAYRLRRSTQHNAS